MGYFLPAVAQSPSGFNYQAIARDELGEVLANQQVSIAISISEGVPTGNVAYSESFSVETNDYGLFSLVIGTGVVLFGTFEEIPWGQDKFYISTLIDLSGGNDFQLLGTQQLMSVPYALYANESGKSTSECLDGFIEVNTSYCIEENEHSPANWFNAVKTCADLNAQLCSWSQWYYAAQNTSLPLSNISDNWEWVDDGGDDKSNNAKAVGFGSPEADDSFDVVEVVNSFRCCCNK